MYVWSIDWVIPNVMTSLIIVDVKNTHLFKLKEVKPEDLNRLNHLKREKRIE